MSLTDYEILTGHLWEAVGTGAGMLMDRGCVEVAEELGYLTRLRRNATHILNNPAEFDSTLTCCRRAGTKAGELAQEDGAVTISPENFRTACLDVQHRIENVRDRMQEASPDELIETFGGACG